MKTTYFTKGADVKKVTIELDNEEQFILVKVALATLIERYEIADKLTDKSYGELKAIEKSFHDIKFENIKGDIT